MENIEKRIAQAVTPVVTNISNWPDSVSNHLWGANLAGPIKLIAAAVAPLLVDLDAGARAVRDLHAPATILEAWGTQGNYPEDALACLHCTSPDDSMPTLHPCPTINALDPK